MQRCRARALRALCAYYRVTRPCSARRSNSLSCRRGTRGGRSIGDDPPPPPLRADGTQTSPSTQEVCRWRHRRRARGAVGAEVQSKRRPARPAFATLAGDGCSPPSTRRSVGPGTRRRATSPSKRDETLRRRVSREGAVAARHGSAAGVRSRPGFGQACCSRASTQDRAVPVAVDSALTSAQRTRRRWSPTLPPLSAPPLGPAARRARGSHRDLSLRAADPRAKVLGEPSCSGG
ncbi:uncharacterized protein LOC113204744 [Frankliniella occidentalis]|uniref:Uncharacterized protein LOC113204744 n=1 Tax=Frankliniella occidentalis TaxID=133901 RepID=A0A9C6X9F0_FRAOC|nr:uncharacterized protein LOC113204744 [Frankliniella occidentalis]